MAEIVSWIALILTGVALYQGHQSDQKVNRSIERINELHDRESARVDDFIQDSRQR